MGLSDQNITADKAAECTLGIQFSGSDMLFCVRHGNEILRAGGERFDFRLTPDENIRRIIDTNGLAQPFRTVCILPVTDKVCVVPPELTGQDSAVFLQANGIAVSENERVLCTEPVKSVTAIVCICESILRMFETLYGGSVRYLHPLQAAIVKNETDPTIEINTSNHLANITLSDISLQFCEVLSYSDPVEILFFLQQLDKEYDLRDYDILVSGDDTQELLKQLKSYYRNVSMSRPRGVRIPKRMRDNLPNFINLIYLTDANH